MRIVFLIKYRSLGRSDLKVSLVGIGCNNFGRRCDHQQTAKIVHCALDQGINFFDTADMYGAGLSEQYLGQAIRDRAREDVIIASKFGNSMVKGGLKRGASRRYIMNAVDDSLRRLGTDYIDLYQQHIPDTETSIEEILRALDDLVSSGKLRCVGHLNFSGWQVSDAHWTAKYNGLNQFVTAQNLYNLLDRRIEQAVIPACEKYGVGVLPFFPLASGLLSGKHRRGTAPGEGTRLAAMGDRAAAAMSDAIFDKVEALTQFAEQSGYSLLQFTMSWLASKAVINSVIAGATSEQQVIANAQGIAWKLTDDDTNHINELTGR